MQLDLPQRASHDTRWNWSGLQGAAIPLAISEFAAAQPHPTLVITPDLHASNRLQRELSIFAPEGLSTLSFSDWETLPYDRFSPHETIISERLSTLYKLPHLGQGIVIIAIPTLLHWLTPKSFVQNHVIFLQVGETINEKSFVSELTESGYRHVDQVVEHGEYTIRGSIIDLFPMGSDSPLRLERFDDVIDTLRTFDPETQMSIGKVDRIEILPAHEYPLDEAGVAQFRSQWRAQFEGNPKSFPFYNSISQGEAISGVEYYLPLFFDSLNTLFDYLPGQSSIFFTESPDKHIEKFWQEITRRYQQISCDPTARYCAPEKLYLTRDHFFQQAKSFFQIHLSDNKKATHSFHSKSISTSETSQEKENPLACFKTAMAESKNRWLFCAESEGRREILLDLFKAIDLNPKVCNSWQDFLSCEASLALTVAPLDAGAEINDLNISLVSEADLFGDKVMQRRARQKKSVDPSVMIRHLAELKIGDPVVHINHGVGRYLGLTLVETGETAGEYLNLEYANDDRIYVPVTSLHLITRYTGSLTDNLPLQKLGSPAWDRKKARAREKVFDAAAELLKIYSEREAKSGFAFNPPNEDFKSFRGAFPFEETPDQTTAIDAVIGDMTSNKPMDRLVCGDVGFGKTEVAMQAVFLAISSGKQVGILVPTTLLAHQHYQNFCDRFANWPVKIAEISRVKNKKEQDDILKQLKSGSIDIIIGTHRLIQNDVDFKSLGLLVVDEEHRFGVRHKEKIKSLRANVDILTLTATPIPRTLNLSLTAIRDLSLITTPPARRLSIKTFIHNYEKSLIRDAISREVMRGGQVYFLHNEVKTIQATLEKLQEIVPAARFAIAHGQMRERELERIMGDFYHQKFNVLICTTIIESGIDVPSANTIIINRADRFGLAQLHQIRGRVGRSNHQAYAYLLVENRRTITSDAKKRLNVLTEINALGAGFNLAQHDLEIRGAGELLGDVQSGHIDAIGFDYYMEMLEAAVNAIKSGKTPTEADLRTNRLAEIEAPFAALFPETYIPDTSIRLTLYKRLSACDKDSDLNEIKAELIDRFGAPPESALNLIDLTHLKQCASNIGIDRVKLTKRFGYLYFCQDPNINTNKMISLLQSNPQQYQLQDQTAFRITWTSDNLKPNEMIVQALTVIALLQT